MPLTDTAIRNATVHPRNYSLSDMEGLSLFVSKSGTKSWHFRYYINGKQCRLSFGSYPEISLSHARLLRQEARAQIARGLDPQVQRRIQQAKKQNTFQTVWSEWSDFRANRYREGRQTSQTQMKRIFANDILPWIGNIPITDVARQDILKILRRLERRQACSVAVKCRSWLNQLFRYAIVKYDLPLNPAADLDIVAMVPPPAQHHPFLKMSELPGFLKAINECSAKKRTLLAIKLLLLTGVRTGELRFAVPDQFCLQKGIWTIPAKHVKQLQRQASKRAIPPYIVPLSTQATEIVKQLMDMRTTRQHYLIAHQSDPQKQMSENTVNRAIKNAGYEGLLTGHGIRGTISTALNELSYPQEWIEAQLSHKDPNKVRAAYNHAQYVEQRQKMMQEWAVLLENYARQAQTTLL